MGAVGYMSPEQVRGQTADHRCDIFAFGAIFYEMLSGRRAFQGDSSVETMSAILKEEPQELSLTSPGLSQLLLFDRHDKQIASVGKAGDFWSPRLSHDGSRVAVEMVDPQSQNCDMDLRTLGSTMSFQMVSGFCSTGPSWRNTFP